MSQKPDPHDTLALAYEVLSLIDVCRCAFDNETSAVPFEQRGIDRSLAVASEKAAKLLDEVEDLVIAPRGKEVTKAA